MYRAITVVLRVPILFVDLLIYAGTALKSVRFKVVKKGKAMGMAWSKHATFIGRFFGTSTIAGTPR